MPPPPQGSAALHWCFTTNNPPEPAAVIPDTAKSACVYAVVGYETGAKGTPHYQGYLCFLRRRRLTAVLKLFKGTAWEGSHWEIAKGTPKEAAEYCKKDGAFEVWGTLPPGPGQATLDRWSGALQVARRAEPDWSEVDPQILISHYRSLNAISADACPPQFDQESCAGLWIAGPTGTGKTTLARGLARALASDPERELFLKEPTRWWDSYRGQETVVLEDLHPNHLKQAPELAGELLLWGDRWVFSGQRKGLPPRRLRPLRFIVTSNYTPDRFFTGPTLAAWSRRAPLALLVGSDPSLGAGWMTLSRGSLRLSGGEPGHWAVGRPSSWWSAAANATTSRPCSSTPLPPSTSPSPGAPSTPGLPAPSALSRQRADFGSSGSAGSTSSTIPIVCSGPNWLEASSSSSPPFDEVDPFAGYW